MSIRRLFLKYVIDDMKCIELKVTIKVPDDYECNYPFDTIVDVNYRTDMEITNVEVLDEYDW